MIALGVMLAAQCLAEGVVVFRIQAPPTNFFSFSISPSSYNFGSACSQTCSVFTITNTGNTTLGADSAELPGYFGIPDQLPPNVGVGESGTFTICFSPSGFMAYTQQIVISYGTVTNSVSLTGTDSRVIASLGVSFTNGSPWITTFTNTSIGFYTNAFYNFGDGSTTNTTNFIVKHTYGDPVSTNNVALTVFGLCDTSTVQYSGLVIIPPPGCNPPIASFSASPTNGASPLAVGFVNNSTFWTNANWTFGDGTVSNGLTNLLVNHTYQLCPSNSTARLIVFGSCGVSTSTLAISTTCSNLCAQAPLVNCVGNQPSCTVTADAGFDSYSGTYNFTSFSVDSWRFDRNDANANFTATLDTNTCIWSVFTDAAGSPWFAPYTVSSAVQCTNSHLSGTITLTGFSAATGKIATIHLGP